MRLENVDDARFVEADHRVTGRAERGDLQITGVDQLLHLPRAGGSGGFNLPPAEPALPEQCTNALADVAVLPAEQDDLVQGDQDRADVVGMIRIPL
jgi:hypothetical protein